MAEASAAKCLRSAAGGAAWSLQYGVTVSYCYPSAIAAVAAATCLPRLLSLLPLQFIMDDVHCCCMQQQQQQQEKQQQQEQQQQRNKRFIS